MKFRAILPFLVYPIIVYFMSYFGIPIGFYSILCFVGGFLCVGLSEYFLHRVAFHNRKLPRKIKRFMSHAHVYHHRYPQRTDDLVLPIFITLPISFFFFSLFVLFFGTEYVFWFYAGEIFSYFLYEFMHYSAHHFPINLPYFKEMRERHLSHHTNSPNSKFMITNPLWDIVFRTYR
jgi:dihydroceramide fatty acyl 2-hydroxylase